MNNVTNHTWVLISLTGLGRVKRRGNISYKELSALASKAQ